MKRQGRSHRPGLPAAGVRLLSDSRLTRLAAKGDERAFAAIFQRYSQSLYRFSLSIVGNAEDAQDALQNTMLKALRGLPGEKRSIQLKPWLYRIAHNESIELLRKRRDEVEVDSELAAPGAGPAETAAVRERLRRLIGDLSELPERQRAAVVMRELGGLDFEQIGEAFETSAAVARQTVYEARLSLRQLAEGREMSCDQVMWQLSEADGRVTRRRDIQAHLRECQNCREFRDSIATRRHDLAALAPLPLAASAGLLHAVLGGSQGSGGLAAGTVSAGAGKAVAASAIVKSAAAVAVVAAVGVTAADRGGLIHVGLPGEGSGSQTAGQASAGAGSGSSAHGDRRAAGKGSARRAGSNGDGQASNGSSTTGAAHGTRAATTSSPAAGKGTSKELPSASKHGQETAASHGGGRETGRSHAHAHVAKPPVHPSPPAHSPQAPSPQPQPTTPPGGEVRPDNSPSSPLQPSQPPANQGESEYKGAREPKEAG